MAQLLQYDEQKLQNAEQLQTEIYELSLMLNSQNAINIQIGTKHNKIK